MRCSAWQRFSFLCREISSLRRPETSRSGSASRYGGGRHYSVLLFIGQSLGWVHGDSGASGHGSYRGHGTFFLTMPDYRAPALDWLHEHPWVKDQLAKLLPLLLKLGLSPGSTPGLVLSLDETGKILRSFQDPEGLVVSTVTAAECHSGDLYLASIAGDWIARCPIGS